MEYPEAFCNVTLGLLAGHRKVPQTVAFDADIQAPS